MSETARHLLATFVLGWALCLLAGPGSPAFAGSGAAPAEAGSPVVAGTIGAPAEASAASQEGAPDSLQEQPAAGGTDAVLYYFHRTFRCHTCLTIQALIEEAVRKHFSDALESGRLQWLPLDIEEPENFHFEDDYELEYNSAILVRMIEGKPGEWANLEKVWDLYESPDAFLAYIKSHVGRALAADEKGVSRQGSPE